MAGAPVYSDFFLLKRKRSVVFFYGESYSLAYKRAQENQRKGSHSCSSNSVKNKRVAYPLAKAKRQKKQGVVVIRQMVWDLLQYRSVRIFLLVFGCILLAAIIQSGLLGPLIMIVVIGVVVFFARGPATIDMVERWVNAPISPLLRKLLIGNPSGVQLDDFMQEQNKVRHFAGIRTLDDLQLLTPSEFKQLVGDVMQHMDYAQVVGRSRDLCVDITAREPNGEQVAVQCKRYTKRNVNSDEMQKFIGMIYLHHHANKGMYFTTSSYTKDARKLGEDNHIELIDGQGLIKIICDL